MYVKNEKRAKEIVEILTRIKEEIPLQFDNESGNIYVEAEKEILDLIVQIIKEDDDYKKCETNFMPYCYPDFTPIECDLHQEDKVGTAWCVNPNCPMNILHILTHDRMVTKEEYIRKCFNEQRR